MSYDISVEMKCGAHEKLCCNECYDNGVRSLEITDSINHTSNCGPMFREAGIDLRDIHHKSVPSCTPAIIAAYAQMLAYPAKFQVMNPPNGWGSYKTALEYLRLLKVWTEQYPHDTYYFHNWY